MWQILGGAALAAIGYYIYDQAKKKDSQQLFPPGSAGKIAHTSYETTTASSELIDIQFAKSLPNDGGAGKQHIPVGSLDVFGSLDGMKASQKTFPPPPPPPVYEGAPQPTFTVPTKPVGHPTTGMRSSAY